MSGGPRRAASQFAADRLLAPAPSRPTKPPMRSARPNLMSRSRRRGVTLLEMLVTVALLLIMMLIIVAIFQSATGAVTVSRAYTLLDQDLRRLDATIRQDLMGVEAIMTPPGINPSDTRPRV